MIHKIQTYLIHAPVVVCLCGLKMFKDTPYITNAWEQVTCEACLNIRLKRIKIRLTKLNRYDKVK